MQSRVFPKSQLQPRYRFRGSWRQRLWDVFFIDIYRPDKLKRAGVKGLILFKHVRVRKGRCFSPWRLWIRGGEDDVALEKMTSEVPLRQTMTGSSGRRSGLIMNASLTPAPLMSPPCTSSRLVLRPILNWQTNFSEPSPTILYPTVLPHMQPRFSFFFQSRLSAKEEIQPEDCFDIVGQSPGKPFLLSNQGCSGFRAIGCSCLNTSSDHNSKKVFEELKMCSVFPVSAWTRKGSVLQTTANI